MGRGSCPHSCTLYRISRPNVTAAASNGQTCPRLPNPKSPSPLKGVKGVPKRKKDKETQAQRTAHSMLEGEMKEAVTEETVHTWDYVSPVAVTEEYLESMYRCVSSI